MSERILYDSAKEGLMKLWVEAQSNGLQGFSEEIWEEIKQLNIEESEKKLTDLRREIESLS